MTRKLVIEITDDEGKTALMKRRNGVEKFLGNIETMFKKAREIRPIKGVRMFFIEEGATAMPLPGAGIVLTPGELQGEAEAGDGSR